MSGQRIKPAPILLILLLAAAPAFASGFRLLEAKLAALRERIEDEREELLFDGKPEKAAVKEARIANRAWEEFDRVVGSFLDFKSAASEDEINRGIKELIDQLEEPWRIEVVLIKLGGGARPPFLAIYSHLIDENAPTSTLHILAWRGGRYRAVERLEERSEVSSMESSYARLLGAPLTLSKVAVFLEEQRTPENVGFRTSWRAPSGVAVELSWRWDGRRLHLQGN